MAQTFTFPVQFQAPVTVAQGLTGTFYGDGSNLTGASLPGQSVVNTTVQSNSANWNTAYNVATAYQSVSGTFATGGLQTTLNYLSTNNVLISSLDVRGNTIFRGNIRNINISPTTTSFNQSSATGTNSFAVGFNTLASGESSFAQGQNNISSGNASHAEGFGTIASGDNSHTEGSNTRALATNGHAEGQSCVAAGINSHAAGFRAVAAQNYTYAWADSNTNTTSVDISTTRAGQYMVSASGGMFIPGQVGIGTDSIANALTVVGNISATQTVFASAVALSSVTFTSETSIQPMSATDVYIKVIVENQERYLPLFALSAI